MEKLEKIAVKDIRTNPFQPRKVFDQEKLEELAQSIKENGLIQPIIVRKSPIIGFELLAGERRFRASKIAGLDLVPALSIFTIRYCTRRSRGVTSTYRTTFP